MASKEVGGFVYNTRNQQTACRENIEKTTTHQ